MCPPAASKVPDIGFDCSNEELFILLDNMTSESALPGNVIRDVNPYNYAPSNLPEHIWYLIHSKENDDTELGIWKVKGEACKLFSNSAITGWRTTLEFFEGQVPREHKTDWVMQKYWITQKEQGEKSKLKEARSLCRVFLGGEHGLDHEKQQNIDSPHVATATHIQSTWSIGPTTNDDSSNGSMSKPGVDNDDDTGKLAVTGRPPNLLVGSPPESDYVSRGDYLELLDLDNPASPSSSSDNSSCLSMSSDEYFDSWALLQEIESASSQDLVQKDRTCKFSVTESLRPNKVVVLPVSPGSFISIGGKPTTKETDLSMRGTDADAQLAVRNQNANRRAEGLSSNLPFVATSSAGGHISSPDGEEKAARRRRKKLRKKYLCFMPFYFLF